MSWETARRYARARADYYLGVAARDYVRAGQAARLLEQREWTAFARRDPRARERLELARLVHRGFERVARIDRSLLQVSSEVARLEGRLAEAVPGSTAARLLSGQIRELQRRQEGMLEQRTRLQAELASSASSGQGGPTGKRQELAAGLRLGATADANRLREALERKRIELQGRIGEERRLAGEAEDRLNRLKETEQGRRKAIEATIRDRESRIARLEREDAGLARQQQAVTDQMNRLQEESDRLLQEAPPAEGGAPGSDTASDTAQSQAAPAGSKRKQSVAARIRALQDQRLLSYARIVSMAARLRAEGAKGNAVQDSNARFDPKLSSAERSLAAWNLQGDLEAASEAVRGAKAESDAHPEDEELKRNYESALACENWIKEALLDPCKPCCPTCPEGAVCRCTLRMIPPGSPEEEAEKEKRKKKEGSPPSKHATRIAKNAPEEPPLQPDGSGDVDKALLPDSATSDAGGAPEAVRSVSPPAAGGGVHETRTAAIRRPDAAEPTKPPKKPRPRIPSDRPAPRPKPPRTESFVDRALGSWRKQVVESGRSIVGALGEITTGVVGAFEEARRRQEVAEARARAEAEFYAKLLDLDVRVEAMGTLIGTLDKVLESFKTKDLARQLNEDSRTALESVASRLWDFRRRFQEIEDRRKRIGRFGEPAESARVDSLLRMTRAIEQVFPVLVAMKDAAAARASFPETGSLFSLFDRGAGRQVDGFFDELDGMRGLALATLWKAAREVEFEGSARFARRGLPRSSIVAEREQAEILHALSGSRQRATVTAKADGSAEVELEARIGDAWYRKARYGSVAEWLGAARGDLAWIHEFGVAVRKWDAAAFQAIEIQLEALGLGSALALGARGMAAIWAKKELAWGVRLLGTAQGAIGVGTGAWKAGTIGAAVNLALTRPESVQEAIWEAVKGFALGRAGAELAGAGHRASVGGRAGARNRRTTTAGVEGLEAEAAGGRGFLGIGSEAHPPSGALNPALRDQFIRNAESWWFRAKADLAAAARGERIDWTKFMERVKSAEFRDYAGFKEAIRSVGYAGRAASGEWLFGAYGPVRRLPFLGDSVVQHELFHGLQDVSYQLFTKKPGFWLTVRAEGAASLFGSPLATGAAIEGGRRAGTAIGGHVNDAIYPEGSK